MGDSYVLVMPFVERCHIRLFRKSNDHIVYLVRCIVNRRVHLDEVRGYVKVRQQIGTGERCVKICQIVDTIILVMAILSMYVFTGRRPADSRCRMGQIYHRDIGRSVW